MNQTVQLWQEILSPSEEFTPIPFWFFNDMPDEEKICRQLENYVQKGVNGIVLHPRIGVPEELPYLSEEYFKAVRFIVKTASDLKMKIVLYDEGMYPSGSAHGMVVAKNPNFASKGVKLVSEQEFIENFSDIKDAAETVTLKNVEIITQFLDGSYLVYTFTGGTIRGIHFGEDDKEDGAPKSADILNPDAVDEFIRLTHDRYYEELKEYFSDTIIAFFTDEPSALGRNATHFCEWVQGLEKEIVAEGGNLEELKGLFTRESNTTTEIYHKLIKKYLREIFYRRLSIWCESHGIVLMGHPEVSDDVEEQLYFHIPGQDLIMRRVSPESGGITEFDSVQAKLTADIARHLGRRRNANECFGVCYRNNIPWYFKAEDMKWYIDWLGIRGVNLFVPHAFYYSVAGARKEERPPDVGPNNIWWPYYREISDYIKRLSYIMTDSVNKAKVAVLCDNNQVPYQELVVLYENQVEFNYLPVALLSECKAESGKLYIKEYEYEAVLNVTNLEWDKRVQEVVGSGGKAECGADSYDKDGEIYIFHDADKLVECGRFATVHTKNICKNLRVSGLHKLSTDMYLFSNEGEEIIEAAVTVPCIDATKEEKEVTLVYADLWRGEAFKVDALNEKGNIFSISLQPRQTMLVIMDDGSLATSLEQAQPENYLGDFTEQFTLMEKKDNCAVYSLNYQVYLVTGTETFSVQAEEMVECYCNGKLVDVGLWSPYRLKVGKYLKEGMNEFRLVVTGSAANMYCNIEMPFGLVKTKK